MSKVVRDSILAGIASLTKVSDFSEPSGFGSDIAGSSDMDANARERSGGDTLVLAEALARRLDCPRGALPGDDGYGIDVRSYLNRGSTNEDIRTLAGQIRNELKKDDRVASLTVRVAPTENAKLLEITIRVFPADPNLETFGLTLSITPVEVLIEELRTES